MEKTLSNGYTVDDIKLQNLRDIIKNIAKSHSQEIDTETKNISRNKREFDIVKVGQELKVLKCFNGFDTAIDEKVKLLEDTVKDMMDSCILVQDRGIKELVPLSYEVLSLIFVSTNELFRQHFFQELVEFYYNELCENMVVSIRTIFGREDFDQQVKALLPIVKLETALKFSKNHKDLEKQRLLEEITSNLTSFFKCSRMNQEDIYTVTENKLGSGNYAFVSYDLTPLDARNGHLGDYFNLKISVEFENTEMVLDLFAKFMTPKMEEMKELVRSGPSKKEEFFYMTYLPLLEEHGLHSLMNFSPRCYLSRINDVLVLDDMASLGFTALTPNIKIEFDGLMFVVKQIAKFHSCSIILEERLSEKEGKKVTLDEIYAGYLDEVLFKFEDTFLAESLKTSLSIIHYLAETFSELNTKFTQDELIEKIDKAWNLMFRQVLKSGKFKNTICHGDMYVGNMLLKFNTYGACLGATLVDFQVLRYCPPVHDLLFFIYQNSLKETRDKHYRELVDGYYSELSANLETFNLDIAKIYPKEEYEESLKYMQSQGLLQALFYSPFNCLEPSLREEIMTDKEMAKKYFFGDNKMALIDIGLDNNIYRRLMRGLVADLVELCESGLM